MTAQSSITSVSGDIEVAAHPSIAAPGALYAVALFHTRRTRSFSRPSGRETALWGNTIDEDRRARGSSSTAPTDPLIPNRNLSQEVEPPLRLRRDFQRYKYRS